MKAADPEAPATRRAVTLNALLVVLMCVVVALVDAKAMIAINSSRALVNPNAATPFAIAFLVDLALSAAYALGSSCLAYADGYGQEADLLIEAELEKHLQEVSHIVDFSQACEVLNLIAIAEGRRTLLDEEITKAEAEYRSALSAVYQGPPARPELSQEHQKELRVHQQAAKFAGQGHQAFELLQARITRHPKGGEAGGGDQ